MEALALVLLIIVGLAILDGLSATSGSDSRTWIDPSPWWPGRRDSGDSPSTF